MNRTQRVRRFRLASLAVSMVAVLAVSLPTAVPALAAGTGTVQIDQAAVPAGGAGATFQITVSSTSDVAVSAVQASVVFDKSLFAITTVTRPSGTDWGTAPQFLVPGGSLPQAIAAANGTGKLATIAASFSCATSGCQLPTLPAGNHLFLTITFRVIACPAAGQPTTSDMTLPIGPADSYLQDGAGDPVSIGTTASKVTVTPCVGSAYNTTTRVSSTLDAGFLAVQVPGTLSIPLLRQVTNTATLNVSVLSDGVWTLNVSDAMTGGKAGSDQGHMTSTTLFGNPPKYGRLADTMRAVYDGQPIRSLDQPFANTNLTTGAGSAALPVTLSQYVGPTDPGPGNFTITLLVTATSGF